VTHRLLSGRYCTPTVESERRYIERRRRLDDSKNLVLGQKQKAAAWRRQRQQRAHPMVVLMGWE